MPMVKTRDGSSVFVRILGRGKPVLLLHGFALDSRQWLPLITPYLYTHKFILPDFRGHGSSPLGSFHRSQALECLCNDIDDILEALQLDQVMLGAYSMGALVGLEYVLRDQGRRVQSYLHIEASPCFHEKPDWPHGFNPSLKERAIRLVELWQGPSDVSMSVETQAAYKALVHEMVLQAFPQTWIKRVLGAIPQSLLQTMLPDPNFTHEFFSFLIDGDYDVRDRINTLTIPGLIMCGRQSLYFPWQGAEWLQKNWRQSQLVLFEASGHGLIVSEPLKSRKVFECFLRGEWEDVHQRLNRRRWLGVKAAG